MHGNPCCIMYSNIQCHCIFSTSMINIPLVHKQSERTTSQGVHTDSHKWVQMGHSIPEDWDKQTRIWE